MRSLVGPLLVVASLLTATVSLADESTDTDRARDEARSGVEAAERGSWSEALAAFRRSFAFSPDSTMLLNIASAEVQTGDLVAAAEDYRRFLRIPEAEVEPEQRAAAARTLERVERRLARLRIVVRALRLGDRVELDGAPLPDAAVDTDIPVNPGLHVARVVRGEAEVAHRVRTLADGESVAIVLEPAEARSSATPEPSRPRSSSIFRSAWLWIGVGAIVAAGTVGVLCATTFCQDSDPKAGSLGVVKLP